jgi:hypothetical protein
MTQILYPARNEKWTLLREIAESLDLTATQKKDAKERYEAVAKVLAESGNPLLEHAKIYPQGSFRLGTSVKPLGREEFDLDFVCHIPVNSSLVTSKDIYDVVGKALSDHGTYEKMLEPKKRCWRLNYAGNFHMDITPSTIDEQHHRDGEMVPDRELSSWKESNPIGYAEWVESIDSISPTASSMRVAMESASIEPLDTDNSNNGVLKRFIQIIKRNRDVYFEKHPLNGYAPISILLTTIAAKSYKKCVERKSYTDMLELFEDVLQAMPSFIRRSNEWGDTKYMVENPSHPKENFAEKWNTSILYEHAFSTWNRAFIRLVGELRSMEGKGLDVYANKMKELLGKNPVERVIEARAKSMYDHKSNGTLGILAGMGMVASRASAVTPKKNTFFGS